MYFSHSRHDQYVTTGLCTISLCVVVCRRSNYCSFGLVCHCLSTDCSIHFLSACAAVRRMLLLCMCMMAMGAAPIWQCWTLCIPPLSLSLRYLEKCWSCDIVYYWYTAQYNSQFDAVVSGDHSGMLEYWSGPSSGYTFPKSLLFQHKMDTDLYEFVKV